MLEDDLDHNLLQNRTACQLDHPGAPLSEVLEKGSTYTQRATGNSAFDWYKTEQVINAVREEGHKARRKHGDAPIANADNLLSVLVEEVGEVAKAINQNLPDEELRKEILHTASVAIRYLAGDLTFSRKP